VLVGALEDVLDRDTQGVFFAVWFLGGLGLFLAVLIVACVVQSRTIRPVEITDRGMTLTNVAPQYIDAFDPGSFEDEEFDRPRPRRRDPDSPHVFDPQARPRPLPPDGYRAGEE
jgi:hypothetical protein